jgi:DNA-directed RNA polymerase specialized sigma subunit
MSDSDMTPKEHVEQMLKKYQQNKSLIAEVDAFIAQYLALTNDEVIELMTLSAPAGDRVQITDVSEKVASVALSYRRRAKDLNREALRQATAGYGEAFAEMRFVEYAVPHLSHRTRRLLTMLVLEHKSRVEVGSLMKISQAEICRRWQEAISQVAELYTTAYERFKPQEDYRNDQ